MTSIYTLTPDYKWSVVEYETYSKILDTGEEITLHKRIEYKTFACELELTPKQYVELLISHSSNTDIELKQYNPDIVDAEEGSYEFVIVGDITDSLKDSLMCPIEDGYTPPDLGWTIISSEVLLEDTRFTIELQL